MSKIAFHYKGVPVHINDNSQHPLAVSQLERMEDAVQWGFDGYEWRPLAVLDPQDFEEYYTEYVHIDIPTMPLPDNCHVVLYGMLDGSFIRLWTRNNDRI